MHGAHGDAAGVGVTWELQLELWQHAEQTATATLAYSHAGALLAILKSTSPPFLLEIRSRLLVMLPMQVLVVRKGLVMVLKPIRMS